jgi:hypothetical protein
LSELYEKGVFEMFVLDIVERMRRDLRLAPIKIEVNIVFSMVSYAFIRDVRVNPGTLSGPGSPTRARLKK